MENPYLLEQLKIVLGKYNITAEDCLSIKSLTIDLSKIGDLRGLTELSNLERIEFVGNNLQNPIDLSYLQQLNNLNQLSLKAVDCDNLVNFSNDSLPQKLIFQNCRNIAIADLGANLEDCSIEFKNENTFHTRDAKCPRIKEVKISNSKADSKELLDNFQSIDHLLIEDSVNINFGNTQINALTIKNDIIDLNTLENVKKLEQLHLEGKEIKDSNITMEVNNLSFNKAFDIRNVSGKLSISNSILSRFSGVENLKISKSTIIDTAENFSLNSLQNLVLSEVENCENILQQLGTNPLKTMELQNILVNSNYSDISLSNIAELSISNSQISDDRFLGNISHIGKINLLNLKGDISEENIANMLNNNIDSSLISDIYDANGNLNKRISTWLESKTTPNLSELVAGNRVLRGVILDSESMPTEEFKQSIEEISKNKNIHTIKSCQVGACSHDTFVESEKVFDSITNGINTDWSELEKARFVYIKLGKLLGYDTRISNNEVMEDSNTYRKVHESSRNIWQSVANGKSVCNGIADTYTYMLKKLGINAQSIDGNTHSFTKLNVDGMDILADLTWDLKNTQYNMRTQYFGNSYQDMQDIAGNHAAKDLSKVQNITSIPEEQLRAVDLAIGNASLNQEGKIEYGVGKVINSIETIKKAFSGKTPTKQHEVSTLLDNFVNVCSDSGFHHSETKTFLNDYLFTYFDSTDAYSLDSYYKNNDPDKNPKLVIGIQEPDKSHSYFCFNEGKKSFISTNEQEFAKLFGTIMTPFKGERSQAIDRIKEVKQGYEGHVVDVSKGQLENNPPINSRPNTTTPYENIK